MARHLATSPTASPASIRSGYSLSSPGYNLALAALLTIFTMAITALIKYVVVQIIHGWDQLFGRSAAAPVAPGPIAPATAEVVDPAAAVPVAPQPVAPVAVEPVAPVAPGVVDAAAAAPLTPGPVAPATPRVVDPAAAAPVALGPVAPVAHGPVAPVGLEPVAPAAFEVVDHEAPEGVTQAADLEEIVLQWY